MVLVCGVRLFAFTACEKEEVEIPPVPPNFIGTWDVEEEIISMANDSIDFHFSDRSVEITLNEDKKGTFTNIISEIDPIHWIYNEVEQTIIIIQETSTYTGATKYVIEIGEDDSQKWVYFRENESPQTGNINSYRQTWIMTRK